ncbi:hypothetical protein BJY21_003712 [Kineosphaera limosa]|uniref:Uncharacterized protein n=1 Tax=Kineosphaera limosa NBRC 100340 TaxID=1184609 RepID=K6WTJ0_9MICO|nr:hypothetical protein [Kineosphaera limosa]NYE02528.1 hypothetical protein [Kineosphaera limosa]GAB97171.1 hypothetical protein KILIM_058_00230 [Kineosphaera limosa NBRC 100340]
MNTTMTLSRMASMQTTWSSLSNETFEQTTSPSVYASVASFAASCAAAPAFPFAVFVGDDRPRWGAEKHLGMTPGTATFVQTTPSTTSGLHPATSRSAPSST